VVNAVEPAAGGFQAIGGGVLREARVVLLAGESLLLRRSDNPAVLHQSGGAVVVVGGKAEDAHERAQKTV
jgi:hypothetical protein